ncbi:hypothetical protein V8G54_022296, partial [Vigna mungo]
MKATIKLWSWVTMKTAIESHYQILPRTNNCDTILNLEERIYSLLFVLLHNKIYIQKLNETTYILNLEEIIYSLLFVFYIIKYIYKSLMKQILILNLGKRIYSLLF